MDQCFLRLQRRLAVITALSFALTPVVGYAIADLFHMVDVARLLHSPLGILVVGAHLLLGAGVAASFYRFSLPLQLWHHTHGFGNPLPDGLQQRLQSFTTRYWSFYLVYVLLISTLQLYSEPTRAWTLTPALWNFMLLQLTIAVLVGMPGYLLCLSNLGQLNQSMGIPHIQVSLKTKMWLIGAYLPILTTAMLIKYHWWRTGVLNNELIVAWTLTVLLEICITTVAIRSLHQALLPVQQVIHGSGASSYLQLAQQLRPHSLDEIGYLVQMLGRLFRRLVDQESHVSAIVDHAAEGIIVVDAQHQIDLFNPAAEKLFGFSAQEIRAKPLRWLLPSLDLDSHDDHRNEVNTPVAHESYGRHRNGASIPMSIRISQIQRNGQLFYSLLVADISERKAAERLLLEAESRYRNLVETAHDLVWSINPLGQWTYLNKAVISIYGYNPEEMLHRHFVEFQAPESAERDGAAFARLLSGKELVQYETIHLDSQGNERYLSFNARPLIAEDGEVVSISGTARDITDQKKFELELTYQAQHDTLTGLYNRSYFQRELDRVIARVVRSADECALVYLDLDQFKYVNDTVGHAAGDRLLIECTELLINNIREGDLVARFGGDEFTVLLYNIDRNHVMTALENIRKVFERYRFLEASQTFIVTCSIGATMIDSQTTSAETALAQADLACNVAKLQGRNCAHLYSAEDNEQSAMTEDIGWIARVRDAIDNDRFELMYQPIFAVHDHSIYGYEVLLRLPTTDGKSIMPGGFIPAAERFGLVHRLDRWTVTRAMQSLAELHQANLTTRFAINLSGRSFDNLELLDIIQGILRETNLNPSALTFEVTETAAIANLQSARKFIGRLKDLGCLLALDDFGTGFCSFTYLKHLPVDTLKIDGSFVQGITQAKVDQTMVQSINQIAHALGKTTIAEFVEDHHTLEVLREIGVDYAQGHYLGKPLHNLLINVGHEHPIRHSLLA
ncbi:MAG: EAL domain-containing protein [Gammaproteobacteria bacterium]|nr:EAL domain-containing protein [Gammaproteobacteria bacterium]